MSIVCSICQDRLTERPQALQEGETLHLVALKCGHVFHLVCAHMWFATGFNGTADQLSLRVRDCPCCKVPSCMKMAMKIFPTCEEEDAVTERENARHEQLIRSLNDEIRSLRQELNTEVEAHENRKLEHAQANSRNDELQALLNEKDDMCQALTNSLKTALEAAELEKQVAINRNKELEEELARVRNSKPQDSGSRQKTGSGSDQEVDRNGGTTDEETRNMVDRLNDLRIRRVKFFQPPATASNGLESDDDDDDIVEIANFQPTFSSTFVVHD